MGDQIKDIFLFKSIYACLAEGILVVDQDGIIIRANPSAEKMFGYSAGEFLDEKVEVLISDEYKVSHKFHRKNYVENPHTRPLGKGMVLTGQKKDGTKFPVEISLNPIKIEEKLVIIAVVVDISERLKLQKTIEHKEREILSVINSAEKKTNTALQESDRRITTLINNLPGVVYQSNNTKNWEAYFISKGCFALTGYHAHEFTNGTINFGDLILEEDKNHVWEEIQKAIKKKKSFNVKYRIRTKNSIIKYVWGQGEGVFDVEENFIALEGFMQDITKQKKLALDVKSFEAKNKAILQAIPDMLFVQDFFGNFLDVYTQKPEKLFLPKEQIIGKNMKEVLPLDVYKIMLKIQKQAIKSKKVHSVEYSLLNENNLNHYEARIVPLNHKNLLTIVRNITEKKEVEERLTLKNQALEAAGNGILIIDAQLPDLPIIYSNDSFVKMTGYSKEEAFGRNCRFLQNDDRDQAAIQVMKSAISQGKPCKVVLRNYRKDGALFWNELTITPIYNDNADLTHFIGVQNDVTIRKKEELLKDHIRKILEMITKHKALKEIGNLIIKTAEENLKNSVVAISLFDEKNESLYHLSGSSLPKKFIKAIDGIAIQYISCNCATAIKTKEEIISEDITRDSNWMEFNKKVKHDFYACWSFPILSSEKTVLGTFSVYYKYPKTPEESERLIISDVVRLASVAIEQHNTNEILQKSREQLEKYTLKLEEEVRFRTMELMTTVKKLVKSNLNFESQIEETKQAEHRALSNQTMFLAIAKNFPKGAIAVVNNDFKIEYIEGRELDNFQVKTEDLMGLSIDNINILNLKQKEAIKKDIVKTLSGDHLTFEVDFKKNTYVINTTPLTSNGDGIQQALFVYSNITEQKQIELDILEALRKEQELNELKSRFISLASHEFRTPLSAILSSANLIGKQPNDQEERRKKYVSIIKSNVKSLATILNDFLSLSKLEEGKVLSEPSKFELIEFCKSIIEEIEPSKKEGQVIAMQHDSKEIEVYFDPKIIRHAVTNLMSNAIKYSKQYDKINITIKKNEKNIVLEVSDQGIGIPSEEQGNLFNRFFRARNAININGIGLGLFIVKQYIELISGTITFESELNKGTTFFVELPINQKNDEKSLTY